MGTLFSVCENSRMCNVAAGVDICVERDVVCMGA